MGEKSREGAQRRNPKKIPLNENKKKRKKKKSKDPEDPRATQASGC
jgi:hypothetical protein